MSTIRSGTDAVEKPTKVEAGQRWQGPAYTYVVEPRTVASVCEAGVCDKYKSCPPTARHAHFTSGTWASEPLMMREWSFLGYAETPGKAPTGIAAWLKPWEDCPCGSSEHQKGGHSPEPPKPAPPVPIRREVSCDGKHWVNYARLVDGDAFEAYPWRRQTISGIVAITGRPPIKPDPITNPRITVTASDEAGAAAAALVGR